MVSITDKLNPYKSFFCICGSIKPFKTCVVAEKARKPSCHCHYSHKQWIEISKKYRYKNGKWRKNGIDDAIEEMKRGG